MLSTLGAKVKPVLLVPRIQMETRRFWSGSLISVRGLLSSEAAPLYPRHFDKLVRFFTHQGQPG